MSLYQLISQEEEEARLRKLRHLNSLILARAQIDQAIQEIENDLRSAASLPMDGRRARVLPISQH